MAGRLFVNCPECGSDDVRSVRTHGLHELFLSLLGLYQFRCSTCYKQFTARPLGVAAAAFAKCPKCCRMDLTVWDPKYYRAGVWIEVKAWLGGNRWRCEPCRCNFVSWRPRKEKYVKPEAPETGEAKPKSDYHELHDT